MLKMVSLPELITQLQFGEIAKAHYVEDTWYVTKRNDGAIVYCSEEGWYIDGLVPLTFSNIAARYEILKN